jgi:hypothetical protein
MELPFVVICPSCNMPVLIEDINCRIFRHAIFKGTGEQMPPHASKIECDEAVEKGWVYGCAKPFLLELQGDIWVAVSCDYI